MQIAGHLKTSLIDYPGHISCVVFTQGCNLRCTYCQNPELVEAKEKFKGMPEETFFDFLNERKKILEGVVITGGEPTLQKDLEEFIKKIKKLGFKVKLDTNGCKPEVIKDLINEKLLDYIAMDVKAPLEKYSEITASKIDTKKIRESIEFIKKSGIGYEFRTTAYPELTDADFEEIGKLINGAEHYYLQQFRPEKTLSAEARKKIPFSEKKLNEIKKIMEKYAKKVEIRGI